MTLCVPQPHHTALHRIAHSSANLYSNYMFWTGLRCTTPHRPEMQQHRAFHALRKPERLCWTSDDRDIDAWSSSNSGATLNGFVDIFILSCSGSSSTIATMTVSTHAKTPKAGMKVGAASASAAATARRVPLLWTCCRLSNSGALLTNCQAHEWHHYIKLFLAYVLRRNTPITVVVCFLKLKVRRLLVPLYHQTRI